MGQVAKAVSTASTPASSSCRSSPALILILAANTAFNGFPVLGSILAQDGYLPRQLHTRGDRLAFSNGILILAGAAAAPRSCVYDAEVTKLIQLYIVGVFVSFTLSQIGMIRHWNRHLLARARPAGRAPGCMRSRIINARRRGDVRARCSSSSCSPSSSHGAGYAIAAMVVLFVLMLGHPHALRPGRATSCGVDEDDSTPQLLPSRGCTRSCSSPRCTSRRCAPSPTPGRPAPPCLEAITVDVDPDETKALQDEWDRRDIPVPLKALDSPYREITRPDHRLRQVAAHRQPARRRRRLHPRVRRSAVVGAGAAQPERAAAQGPPAVHPGRHGRERPVAAAPRPRARRTRLRRARRRLRPPRRVRRRRAPRRRARRRRRGGASRSARSPTAGTAWPGTRVGSSSCATPCPASGSASRVTEADDGQRFVRADAVEVLEAVAAPRRRRRARMPGPGRCGGCDFQHVALPHQRALKAEPSSASSSPGWPGSTSTSPSSRCPATTDGLRLAHPGRVRRRRRRPCGAAPAPVPRRRAPSTTASSPTTGSSSRGVLGAAGRAERAVDAVAPVSRATPSSSPCPAARRRHRRPRDGPRGSAGSAGFEVSARGFWQVHPGAAATFVDAVLEALAPQAGERASTCMPGWACSRLPSPTPSASPARSWPSRPTGPAVVDGARRNAGVPAAGSSGVPGEWTACSDRWCGSGSVPTSSSSTRRAPAPAAT